MQIYSKNNKNCFFSLISWPIFILFVLSDRARWGLQNLYTKFRNSIIMLIYANLFKITKKKSQTCFFISQPILIWFALSGRAKLGTLNFYTEFGDFAPLINYGNLCKFIPKITKIASSPSFLDRFSFCLFYLIGLGRGFKTCTKLFRNWLIMLIYANVFKITPKKKIAKNASPSFLNRFWFGLLYLVELSLIH